jgi:tRNA A37 threonylcarbamoyladenosine biosynthesis protein TsaE
MLDDKIASNIDSILLEDMEKGSVIIEWSEKLPKKILKKGQIIEIIQNDDNSRTIKVY